MHSGILKESMKMTARPFATALTRRQAIKTASAGALALVASGLASGAVQATPEKTAAYISKAMGGKAMKEGKITIKLPEIAENGATVPVTVSVDSPMTASNYVKRIVVAAEKNPNPEVATFNLGPASGKAEISTRIRLGGTQNVVAAVEMSDGTIYTAKREVKVTIGGCGG